MHLLSHQTAQGITLLLLSTLLGGAIGYERERHERPAGLRTHIIVCLAATLITVLSKQGTHNDMHLSAQIVTGVGFLGAGTILRDSGGAVRGLTTAASLWLVAAIGIAVGFGGIYAGYACATTFIALFVLVIFGKFELIFGMTRTRQDLTLLCEGGSGETNTLAELLNAIRARNARVLGVETTKLGDGHLIKLTLAIPKTVDRQQIESLLSDQKNILHHSWAEG
jgi:putative Mg2+ transporter-C (MgtC) family protein